MIEKERRNEEDVNELKYIKIDKTHMQKYVINILML